MSDIDDLLEKESVKDLIDKTIEDIDQVEGIIIAYTRKDGSLHWRSNCRRSEGVGIVTVVKQYLLREE